MLDLGGLSSSHCRLSLSSFDLVQVFDRRRESASAPIGCPVANLGWTLGNPLPPL